MNRFLKKQAHALLQQRKILRKNATPAEKELWKYIRKKQLGAKFIRQYSVGPYILDFYSPQQKLAIELDGKHHASPEVQEYDSLRTQFLHSMNIRVIRFWNTEVTYELENVLKKIRESIPPRPPSQGSLPQPSLYPKGGRDLPSPLRGVSPLEIKRGQKPDQMTRGDQFT